MKVSLISLILYLLATITSVSVSASELRITCKSDDVGAKVQINGEFKGVCPISMTVAEGKYTLRVFKTLEASYERVFEQDVSIGEGVLKKIEAVLSTARMSKDAQNREDAKILAQIADAMVTIPAGSFMMGSNDSFTNERPLHRITIAKPFALSKTEVTQRQWRMIMGNNPSTFTNCGEDCPVETISWNDAQAFIQKLNAKTGQHYRLPTEAEWEYACHAGKQHPYCGGDYLDSVAWFDENSPTTTQPVGRKQANAFGLFDMSGNVWEWVEDSYHDSYKGAPTDGSAWSGDGVKRVLRGGSWNSEPQDHSATYRFWSVPAYRYGYGFGFRLARILP
ncbi:SUMF1/EgtB/PvdO family nonheme iron enzyme [Sulfurirhabdus autotrophica]|uniref:Formylglycine-generating enzyme required for sulfatase activity n=1 Tax=Sulfurirhabdus autotrophica TaxID=1706046 RepID=A0A4R3YHB1_9PROT|nr:SUMF1/EgtB/PvdO family nonheme iron enzyme [Sulfurirhabdus autotrophica]TCV90648.1 formylglycine-generating enzyme required for sulfatase activity [Sulfurirhabdus autotrophica]